MPLAARPIDWEGWSQSRFLAWAEIQPEGCRYEFDGFRPVERTPATVGHNRIGRNIREAIRPRLPAGAPCDTYGPQDAHQACWPEVGSGAVPRYEQRDYARIPDAMIRCGKHPRIMFDVVSPSELHHKRDRDLRRSDLQAVEGVQESVEIYHDEMLAHAYRRQEAGWVFQSITGAEAEIALPSVGIGVKLAALYLRVELAAPGEQPTAAEP